MINENPWFLTYRPEINSEIITLTECIKAIEPKNEMNLSGFSL